MQEMILLAGFIGFVSGFILRDVYFRWRLKRKVRRVSAAYRERRGLNDELCLDPAFEPTASKLRGAAALKHEAGECRACDMLRAYRAGYAVGKN